MTFYELDPAVKRIACNPEFFTYFDDFIKRGGSGHVVLGDARIKLEGARPHEFGLIVIDAFSSDAIPVHLLTLEALQLYLAKLERGGLLAFHISNRFLDLEPVLGNLCAGWGSSAGRSSTAATTRSARTTRIGSCCADEPRISETCAHDERWRPLSGRYDIGVWTDDFSNPLRLLSRN